MTMGERIKQARKRAGITQKELGAKLGVSQVMIAQYESNKRQPKIETVKKIAKALNIELTDLIPELLTIGNAIETDINDVKALLDKLPEMGLPEETEKEYQEWALNTITERQKRLKELGLFTSNNAVTDYIQEINNFLFHNPEYKTLFDSVMCIKKEDIDFIKTLLDRVK